MATIRRQLDSVLVGVIPQVVFENAHQQAGLPEGHFPANESGVSNVEIIRQCVGNECTVKFQPPFPSFKDQMLRCTRPWQVLDLFFLRESPGIPSGCGTCLA